MATSRVRFPAAVFATMILIACGEKSSVATGLPAAPPAPASAPVGAPAPAPEAAPAAAAPVSPAAEPAPAPKADAAPAPAPKSKPAPPPAAPAPPPNGAASARAKVGADKCKMCHRVQHQSWAASPHAAKGIDCERCHGNGGDYWPAGVMRDRAKADAAGLVMPTLASCKKCHAKADAALFANVHAHKPK